MIIIYKELIRKYISKLTPSHIKDYARDNQIYVTDDEVSIIHQFIMNHYENLLEKEETLLLLKPLIREDLFQTIQSLYKENKAKYLS